MWYPLRRAVALQHFSSPLARSRPACTQPHFWTPLSPTGMVCPSGSFWTTCTRTWCRHRVAARFPPCLQWDHLMSSWCQSIGRSGRLLWATERTGRKPCFRCRAVHQMLEHLQRAYWRKGLQLPLLKMVAGCSSTQPSIASWSLLTTAVRCFLCSLATGCPTAAGLISSLWMQPVRIHPYMRVCVLGTLVWPAFVLLVLPFVAGVDVQQCIHVDAWVSKIQEIQPSGHLFLVWDAWRTHFKSGTALLCGPHATKRGCVPLDETELHMPFIPQCAVPDSPPVPSLPHTQSLSFSQHAALLPLLSLMQVGCGCDSGSAVRGPRWC